jgi:hypothetical protein
MEQQDPILDLLDESISINNFPKSKIKHRDLKESSKRQRSYYWRAKAKREADPILKEKFLANRRKHDRTRYRKDKQFRLEQKYEKLKKEVELRKKLNIPPSIVRVPIIPPTPKPIKGYEFATIQSEILQQCIQNNPDFYKFAK